MTTQYILYIEFPFVDICIYICHIRELMGHSTLYLHPYIPEDYTCV